MELARSEQTIAMGKNAAVSVAPEEERPAPTETRWGDRVCLGGLVALPFERTDSP